MLSLLTAYMIGHAQTASAQCSIATCQQPVTVGGFNVGAQVLATANYNDWFINGSNQGVIANDANTQQFITDLMNSGHYNLTYEQRMSVPFATVVTIAGQPVLMLDAVAARDNHCAGGQVDSTIFGSGADKNAANPATWTLGISSVPQKNDIIDVGGHIRRTDDGTGNDALFGYAYATTRNTSGDSHLDFEIYRTFPQIIGGQLTYNNGLPGTGPDGGHTASVLDCNPANFKPGDLIVSIDYSNGGQNACVSVYVWVNPNDVDGLGHNLAWYNGQACRRFNFTGAFYSGTGAAPFGYAEITPLNGSATACLVRAVANTAAGIQAGPWGNLSAQNAAFQTTYEPLQLVEVAINFSALGLDIQPTLGPCVNIFGSLSVKTRSSTSFTSELKDWAGPYLFGAFSELNADAGLDKNLSCTYPTANLCGSSSNTNATYEWFKLPSYTSIGTTQCVTVNQPGTYMVVVTDNNLPTCSDSDIVVVTSVIDSIPPDVTCPPNITVSCNNLIPAGATTYKDFLNQGGTIFDISGDLLVSFTDSPPTVGNCGVSITRTYTVQDTCDNIGSCTQIITVNDTINPIVSGPADVTLGCNPTIPAPNTGLITATDNCTTPVVTVLPDAVTGTCYRTLTRTYRATDGCNNTTDFIQKFNYKVDLVAPVITHPGGASGQTVDLGCNPTASAIENTLGQASATDNCDASVTTTVNNGPVTSNGCFRSQTRTWNAVDSCGNNATAFTRTATWKVDVTAPVITLNGTQGANPNLGCNPSAAQIESALGTASVSDACDNLTANATTGTVQTNGCFRTQTRTFNAVDLCGNNATALVRTVTWKVDTDAPVITPDNGNLDLGCNPTQAQIENALGSATVIDNCDNLTVTTTTSQVTSNGCFRSQTRSWNATDLCNNVAVQQSVTVTWKVDVTAPTITLNGTQGANPNLGCNPTAAAIEAALGTATATDNCDNVNANPVDGLIVSNGCLRTQTRTWNAVDLCGNNATAVVRTVSWKVDTDAPVITPNNNDANLGCNPTAQQIENALGGAIVTDNCDNLTVVPTTGAVQSNGCIRTQTRTWNATDLCGNQAASQSVTVTWSVDNQPPVIQANGTSLALGCNPTQQQIEDALGTATATDACGTVTPSVSTGNVISNGCNRSQTRTWSAIDACGNNAVQVSRTVTWKVDVTAPVITLDGTQGANPNLGCNPTPAQIEAALGTATVTDNCDNLTANVSTGQIQSNGCFRTQTRTFNAVDLCGNNATAVVRTVTWKVDVTAPVITLDGTQGANPNLGCNPTPAQIEAALGTATVTDNCDNLTASVSTGQIQSNGCSRTQTRTFNAVDLCGNNATAVVRTVTWKVDVTAPVITLNGTQGANPNLGCNPTPAQIEAALGTATVTDNCDNLTATVTTGQVQSNGCLRTQTRTFNAVDLCGNNATAVVRTVTWKVDTQAPVVTCHTSSTITVCEGSPVTFTPSASDNCDGVLPVTCTRSDGQPLSAAYPVGTTTVTCTATDDCGNTGNCTLTIRVIDNPVCTINFNDPSDRPFCGSCSNSLTTNISGLDGTTTYSWTVDNSSWTIDNPSIANITYCAGSDTANFTLTVTNTVNGVNCTSTCTVQIVCKPTHTCTYTQGAYGNAGGMHCNGLSTTAILLQQLATPLVIGDCSVGRCLTLTSSDVTSGCIYRRLPGGGPSATITDEGTCDIPSGIATKGNGSFRNVLVAQTITLGLNLRVPGSGLGAMPITGPYMVTLASSGNLCNDPSATPIPGTEIVRMIPTSVLAYLGANNTVQDLFEATNQALAGTLPAGAPSLSTWNSAVSAFNEGFDECRILAGFYPTNPLDTTNSTTNNRLFNSTEPVAAQVYPNPASDLANIEFILNGFDSDVQVEVFDLNGTRIDVLFNATADSDVRYRVEFKAGELPAGVYMYHITTSKGVLTDKITVVK